MIYGVKWVDILVPCEKCFYDTLNEPYYIYCINHVSNRLLFKISIEGGGSSDGIL